MIDVSRLTPRPSPNFSEGLRRDVPSLSTTFRKHGLHENGPSGSGDGTLREVQRHLSGPAPEPRVRLP